MTTPTSESSAVSGLDSGELLRVWDGDAIVPAIRKGMLVPGCLIEIEPVADPPSLIVGEQLAVVLGERSHSGLDEAVQRG